MRSSLKSNWLANLANLVHGLKTTDERNCYLQILSPPLSPSPSHISLSPLPNLPPFSPSLSLPGYSRASCASKLHGMIILMSHSGERELVVPVTNYKFIIIKTSLHSVLRLHSSTAACMSRFYNPMQEGIATCWTGRR